MGKAKTSSAFEEAVLPHLGAAFNLARWLAGNDNDAEDIVQEAYLRAFRFFESFHGGNVRAWLLTIVRHTYYHWYNVTRNHRTTLSLDDEGCRESATGFQCAVSGDLALSAIADAMLALTPEFREIIVLRELENLSYKEISDVLRIPVGTVMSRLSRARAALKGQFCGDIESATHLSFSIKAVDNAVG